MCYSHVTAAQTSGFHEIVFLLCGMLFHSFLLNYLQIIRKVDKQTALLDADDPVSQLHKVSHGCSF